MPTTANFALPYPGALDEPCDFPQDWCAFTDAAAAVQAEFQSIADRVWPVQPVAKLDLTTPTAIPRNSIVPFDSATFDNADYVDFDVSTSTITAKRAGRYFACFNAFMSTTFVANSRFLVDFELAVQSEDQSEELDLATSSVAFVANAYYVTVTPPIDIYVILDSSATAVATLNIQRASLSLYWFADRASP